MTTQKKNKRQKEAEQKNAPDWLTRPIFGYLPIITSRTTITIDPGDGQDVDDFMLFVAKKGKSLLDS